MKGLLKTSLRPELFSYLQRVVEFSELWRTTADLSRDFYATLKKTTVITSAGASTRIEGATLSDEEILKRLSGLKIKKIRDRDEAEVAGYLDVKKYIFDHYQDLPVTEYSIRSLHQMMMVYLSESLLPTHQRGAYKNVSNAVVRLDQTTGAQEIVFKTTPPGPQTATAMRELVEDYQSFIHDPNYSNLEVIAAFIVKFLSIHPFRDGNGRLSRLLTDLCLLREGYQFCMYSSHEKVIEDTKEQYYIALRQTQTTLKPESGKPDLNPWFLYFLKILEQQTMYLKDKILPEAPGTLTRLEQEVYDLMVQHQPVTIGFLERSSRIKRVTLKSILARLKGRGLLVMEGTRKGARYRVK